ncbi:MAG: hypothetical protein SGBAC_005166 [Bacillariaceae sp.]
MNNRSCALTSVHNSASSIFEYRENLPPTVDASRDVQRLQGAQTKKKWLSQSSGAIHHLSRRKTPCFKQAESRGDSINDKISKAVRDAFIPPRYDFVNKKKTQGCGATEKSTITPSGIIFDLGERDIVCGRGAPSTQQGGNKMFRELVEEHQASYLCSKRADKPKIAMLVMEEVRARGGRFVRRVKTATNGRSFGWEELDEKRCYEKVCQALREGAPEIRRRMLSCSQIREDTRHKDPTPPERLLPVFQGASYSCRIDVYQ